MNNTSKQLLNLLNTSEVLSFNDNDKIIIMSDCHRGTGSRADNFYKNKNIYLAALRYYYKNNYTYIEIGDGDELWENKNFKQIISTYSDIFSLLYAFHKKNKLYMLFGNHDIVKRKKYLLERMIKGQYNNQVDKLTEIFKEMHIYESLLLRHIETDKNMLITHGHQGDLINDKLWRVTKFMIKYVWRPLELVGVQNPFSPATNIKKQGIIEKKLIEWTKDNKQILITGHTHKPLLTKNINHLYFNSGSCVFPSYITGIELNKGSISLIKWSISTREDRSLFINRDILITNKIKNLVYRQ